MEKFEVEKRERGFPSYKVKVIYSYTDDLNQFFPGFYNLESDSFELVASPQKFLILSASVETDFGSFMFEEDLDKAKVILDKIKSYCDSSTEIENLRKKIADVEIKLNFEINKWRDGGSEVQAPYELQREYNKLIADQRALDSEIKSLMGILSVYKI